MSRRGGLGRGLESLIPTGETPAEEASSGPQPSGVSQLPVEAIAANPSQPREHFDTVELDELAQSIREHGILQPLIVTPGETPGSYILIAGERRLLAARRVGLSRVPALVRDAGDLDRLQLALIENVQRADLSPLELAEAYRRLSDEFSLSHETIAARVGKSRAAVTNTLRLLKLPEGARSALASGRISEGHARALLALPTPQAQAAALHSVLTHDLSVRQTEELVRRMSGERPAPAPRPEAPPEVAALQERLQSSLGTRVRLRRSRKGSGSIIIHYYSDEELNALVERLAAE